MSPAAIASNQSYFEDVELGVLLESPGITLTEAHAALFRGVVGEDAGVEPGQVPVLLPLCLSSGLGWRISRPPLAVLAFMGLEWRSLEPIHLGDTIRSISVTQTKRSMREGGVVIEERRIVNQRDETVQLVKLTLLVAKRSKA